jgi:hypothetical protein
MVTPRSVFAPALGKPHGHGHTRTCATDPTDHEYTCSLAPRQLIRGHNSRFPGVAGYLPYICFGCDAEGTVESVPRFSDQPQNYPSAYDNHGSTIAHFRLNGCATIVSDTSDGHDLGLNCPIK